VKRPPWTDETAITWADLNQVVRRLGFTVGVKDTMISASSEFRGLTDATRNADDFTRCSVAEVNPFG